MIDFFFRYRLLSILLFFVTLSICLITFQLRVLDKVVLFTFSPIEKTIVYGVDQARDFLYRYHILLVIRDEYTRLRKENLLLKSKLIDLEEMKNRLQRLEALLAFSEEIPYQTISARVIGKSPISSNSTLLIDKGSVDGIRQYQGVIDHVGVIGRIIGVSNNSAKVQMIVDKNCSVAVLNQRTRDNGLIRGLGFTTSFLQMDFVYYRSHVEIGDVIITSGLDDVFPKGLLIGSVKRYDKTGSGLFYKRIEIEPAAQFNRVEEVLIVLQPNVSDHP